MLVTVYRKSGLIKSARIKLFYKASLKDTVFVSVDFINTVRYNKKGSIHTN